MNFAGTAFPKRNARGKERCERQGRRRNQLLDELM